MTKDKSRKERRKTKKDSDDEEENPTPFFEMHNQVVEEKKKSKSVKKESVEEKGKVERFFEMFKFKTEKNQPAKNTDKMSPFEGIHEKKEKKNAKKEMDDVNEKMMPFFEKTQVSVNDLHELSEVLLKKCKASLRMNLELTQELQSQLKRIDTLKDMTGFIKRHIMELQFTIERRGNFWYKIFPFLMPNFQQEFTTDILYEYCAQADVELELTVMAFHRFGQRTPLTEHEKETQRKLVDYFPEKGAIIKENMDKIDDVLYSLRLKSLTVMIELMLQLEDLPVVITDISNLNDQIIQATKLNKKFFLK